MMMMSNIPVAGMIPPLKTNDQAKERILSSVQIAVKQVQSYYSICNTEYRLSIDVQELYQLCDSLDKTLFYGLKECQHGYWPFVKHFTHGSTVKFIESLSNAPTQIQCGRAWLCLALNENSLESYFQSFQENLNVVRKYYFSLSVLRDEQRRQLLLMLMAGLENIPINLEIEKVSYGTGLSFFGTYLYTERSLSRQSSDISQYGNFGSSSQSSSQDIDAGVIECDDSDEVGEQSLTGASNSSPDDDWISVDDVHCNLSSHEIERITKYINMSPQNELAHNTDLEVIRTKVVRRLKKSPVHNRNTQLESDMQSGCTEEEEFSKNSQTSITKENRLSKATTDSGVCLESHSSSDRDSPELNEQIVKKELSFDVGDLQPELNVIFSTPVKHREIVPCENSLIPKPEMLPEMRGAPEGQEDPAANACTSQIITSRQPLLSGNDGLEEEEEEISFYDLCKVRYLKHCHPKDCDDTKENLETEDNVSVKSAISQTTESSVELDLSVEKLKAEDPVAKEIALLSASQSEERHDFRLDNNTLLYLLVEIYELEDEEFYKMFYGYLRGSDQMVLFLLTNKCAYVLKRGGSECKFICSNSAKYTEIEFISVFLNYQGFSVVNKNDQKFSLYTADEYLTRSILSSMEVAIRRSLPKIPLPGILTHGTMQIRKLSKYLAKELKCLSSDVSIHHFVLARYEDFDGSSSPVTPAGPRTEGFLLYRHRHKNNCRNDDTWLPGYFVLNGGVLYCMEEQNKTVPLFFVEMCAPNCKGCRRLHSPQRPHAFEIILANDDCLQLAAADEYEASHWQISFLQVVSLTNHFVDIDVAKPVPCFVVICNESIVIAEELPLLRSLGKASLCDLITVFYDSSVPNSILLEFEIAEASKSCGAWIITFDSEIEKEKFLSVLKCRWLDIFQHELTVSAIKDFSLIKKLRLTNEEIASQKQELQDLCFDS